MKKIVDAEIEYVDSGEDCYVLSCGCRVDGVWLMMHEPNMLHECPIDESCTE